MYIRSQKVVAEPVKFNLRRKDYAKIKAWYEEYNQNYFYHVALEDEKDFYKEIHFRIYFSQIVFSEKFMNLNLKSLSKLNPKGLNIIGNIQKCSQQIFVGKTYQSKHIECRFAIQSKSFILQKQVDLYFYVSQTKKRDTTLVLQLSFLNQDGEYFKLGRINYNINYVIKGQIVDIALQNNKKEKIGVIPALVEYDPISQLKRYLPSCVIIDQSILIPPLVKFHINAKGQHFTLQNKIKLKLANLKLQIKELKQFMNFLQKNINPFPAYHHQLVTFQIKDFQLTLGSHNSWKFIDIQKESLKFKLVKLQNLNQQLNNSIVLVPQSQTHRKLINKTIFDCENQLLIAILSCKIKYQLNASVIKDTKQVSEVLGWVPILTNLSQQKVQIDILFQNIFSLPGYIINIPSQFSIIKLNTQIQHTNFKDYKKKYQEKKVTQQYIASDHLLQNRDFAIQTVTKNFMNRRNATISSSAQQIVSHQSLRNVDEQIESTLKQMQKYISQSNNRVIMKGSSGFRKQIGQLDKQVNTEWQHVLSLKSKILKIGLKLKSIIPLTQNTIQYYLPKQMDFKFYLFRKTISAKASVIQNYATFGMPSYLKSKKEMTFIQIPFSNQQEIMKLHDSIILLEIQDQQINQLYSKGQYKASSLLHISKNVGQSSFIKIPLKNIKKQNQGFLVLQVSFSIKKWQQGSRKNQIEQISNQKIIKSLPMKERMIMRINNYNNSNKEMKNKAIQMYKQKNHENYVQNVIKNQINNKAELTYQIGIPTYCFLEFTNQHTSQNNIFTLKIQNPFIEIITSEKQYKQICEKQNLNMNAIPLNKIQFKMGNLSHDGYQNNYYETKIKHNTQIGILLKVLLQEWNSKIPQIQNFYLQILRNTLPVKTYKFKLIYKQPIITEVVHVNEINSHQNSQIIKVSLPQEIINRYKNFLSYSKNLQFVVKRRCFRYNMKQPVTSPFVIEMLISGQLFDRKKLQNILIKLKILDGKTIQLQLGSLVKQVIPINTNLYPALNGKILEIKKQSLNNNILLQKQLFSILGYSQIELFISCLEECSNKDILVDLFQFQGDIKYQYLFKMNCRLKKTTIKVSAQNYVGQIIKIKLKNNYSSAYEYFLRSSTKSFNLIEQKFMIQKSSSYLTQLQVIAKLPQTSYIILYDKNCFVTQIYQIIADNSKSNQVFEIVNQIRLKQD